MRIALFLSIIVLSAASCASLREIPNAQPDLPAPVIRVIDARAASEKDTSSADAGPAKIVLKVGGKSALSDADAAVVTRRIIRMLENPGVEIVESGKDIPADAQGQLFLDFDLPESGSGKVTLRLTDPAGKYIFGETVVEASVEKASALVEHEVDLYSKGGTVNILPPQLSTIVKLTSQEPARLREFVLLATTGFITVQSAYPGARVVLMRGDASMEAGNAPVVRRRATKGRWRVQVHRRGYGPFEREVLVKPGQTTDVFAAWADDPGVDALVVHSSPQGLTFSMDGVVKGETPLFITGVAGGSHAAELSDPGTRHALAEGEVAAGDAAYGVAYLLHYDENFDNLLFDRDYLQLTSEAGVTEFVPASGMGIKSGANAHGWQGFATRGLPMVELEAEVDVVTGQGNTAAFGVVVGKESVLMQVKDGVFSVGRFKDGAATGIVKSYTSVREGSIHTLRIEYDPGKKQITARMDGDVVLREPMEKSALARLVILTRSPSVDGRTVVKTLRVRSGPEDYREKLGKGK